MNIMFFVKFILIVFAFTQSGFAYDSVIKHYDERRIGYIEKRNIDTYTDSIHQILSTEDLIDPNLHDFEKKKKVIQAVMASVIIHQGKRNLSGRLPQRVINSIFEDHFKIITLTEKISLGIVKGRYDPADFRLLKEYSGIEKTIFLDWFIDTCLEHQRPDLVQRIEEREARQKSLQDELIQLRAKSEEINVLERQIDRNTLARNPHHYDGNIPRWANELWGAFAALNPINIPSAKAVEDKIMAAAKDINQDGLIAERYKSLRGPGFGVAQNLLQQIVGWNTETVSMVVITCR